MLKTEKVTFDAFLAKVHKQFKSFDKLFYVEVDREQVWQEYLNGFAVEERQEHNCNCCKSFLRQYAGIVTIKNEKVVSIWDGVEDVGEYQESVNRLRKYVHSRPITGGFLAEAQKVGTQSNFDLKRSVTWTHFYLQLPAQYVCKADQIPAKLGQIREDTETLKRSLDTLTIDATETVLELIEQNSLYRGKEFDNLLRSFLTLQRSYKKTTAKDLFCWLKASEAGPAMCRIKNTSIGTLLVDLSEGTELDDAVRKFERVVAPANYKRPTSLVTPKMVEQAKETLNSLGLLESLNRRHANESDLNVLDVLFTDRTVAATDVFASVAKESVVNPKTLAKVEEITIQDFLDNVVPKAKTIELLLENHHLGNFVSLITGIDKEAKPLFKWENLFSWSYSGNVADSIKERVKQAGGNVVGELRTSLSWSNYDDLDIHVKEPDGNTIYFGSKRSRTSGNLDVDMNAGGGKSRTPVENIIWTDKGLMKEGKYEVKVHNFCKRETDGQGFEVQVECNGETFDFGFTTNPRSQEYKNVCTFTYSKKDGIKFDGEVKSNVVSKEKWGLKTQQFHKVNKLMLSPNHWGANVGNRHYMFFLEGCLSDETPRPFYNEFLKPELDQHRKVFEILGGKVKVEDSSSQLSGVGFSDTQKNSVTLRVTGRFSRILKVSF